MSAVTRRDFLAGLTIGAASAVLAAGSASAAPAVKKGRKGSDLVTLGRSGLKSSLLGMGTGTRGGREQLGLGSPDFVRMVRHGLERGVRYIDTADGYSTHVFVRLALEGVKREDYFLLTKTRAQHPEVAKADIDRFCRELRVKYLDCLLMHCMRTATFAADMRPVMDVLQEAKEKGKIRAVGISCHGWEPLAASVDCNWIDVQLARINPFGKAMDGEPADVAAQLKKMHDQGRGVLGMKIFGETGLENRQQRVESLRYVLGLGCVDAFTIGFTSPQQIDETLDLIEEATA